MRTGELGRAGQATLPNLKFSATDALPQKVLSTQHLVLLLAGISLKHLSSPARNSLLLLDSQSVQIQISEVL
jgi:hypothetical protein